MTARTYRRTFGQLGAFAVIGMMRPDCGTNFHGCEESGVLAGFKRKRAALASRFVASGGEI